MSGQNWRTEIDASDYFGHQKKRVELEQRRPVVRKASDLVGPGIGSDAVRITNFNDVLATFNGYYSAAPGALNAPTGTEAFIGTTVSDPALGGRQTLTGLSTGFEYTRVFVRNASDAASISWGTWQGTERVPASATKEDANVTSVSNQGMSMLTAPSIKTIGASGTYEQTLNDINVLRPGVYTGYLTVGGPYGLTLTSVVAYWPDRGKLNGMEIGPIKTHRMPPIPFTFWATGEVQQIRVYVGHQEATDQNIVWDDFSITRVGDLA